MKPIWFSLLSLLCVGCVSIPNESIHTALSSHVLSQYELFNGVVVHDDLVVQTDITATFPGGFQLGVWYSAGLNDDSFSSDFGDEVDYTVGWNGKVGQTSVSAGVSYFDILELGHRTKGVVDVLRPYIVASQSYEVAENHTLGPVAKLEGKLRVEGHADAGVTLWLGIQHAWKLNPRLDFNQKLRVIGDTGSIGFHDIILGRYDAGFAYRLGKNVAWNVLSFTATTPFTSAADGQETSTTYGTGLTIKF